MINKKAQGMSTNTIILLILGLAVMIILILGFTMGWSKIAPFISTSNVGDVVSQCEAACSVNSKYDYCTATRELKDTDKNVIKTSCSVFANEKTLMEYGVSPCNIDCSKQCSQIKINDKNAVPLAIGSPFDYDVSSLANDLNEGQACLINL